MFIYNSRAGWSRANDNMLAYEKYFGSGEKGIL